MYNSPKISIIIPTFNSEKTIVNTLYSVKKQSFPNWECYVIDGLSKDNTKNIVNEFVAKDPRYKLLSEKDSGIYDAMNKGWKVSRGQWILFLGSDDSLASEDSLYNISKQLTDEYDIIYGDYNTIDLKGNMKKNISLDYHCIKYKVFSNHQAIIMKRNIIEKLDGFNTDYKITADFDLIQRAYLSKFKFKHVPVVISNFYLGGISSNNINTYFEWWKVCKNNHSIKFPFAALLYGICRYIRNNLFKS